MRKLLRRLLASPARRLGVRHRRRAAEERQRQRIDALRDRNTGRLASGRWTQIGRIAFLTEAPLSDHLRRTVVARELDGRTALRREFYQEGSGTCTVLIDAGVAVLHDPVARRYLRASNRARFDAEYVRLRGVLARYVPSPRFTVEDDGRVLSEEALDGVPIDTLSPTRLAHAVDLLLAGFCDLASQSTERLPESRRTVLRELHAALDRELRGPDTPLRVDRGLLEALLLTDTAAPGKGPSLGQNNLMVVDGRLHCIDFQFVTLLPRWSDPATLLVSTLPSAILEETSDDPVARVMVAAAVDHEYRGTPAERAALVLATIAVGRIRIDRPDPLREAERRGIEEVAARSLHELRRDWSDLLAL